MVWVMVCFGGGDSDGNGEGDGDGDVDGVGYRDGDIAVMLPIVMMMVAGVVRTMVVMIFIEHLLVVVIFTEHQLWGQCLVHGRTLIGKASY